MKNKAKHNWLIDAVLFSGFIVATILDLTGLAVHQWLGIAVGALAVYHLLSHWSWVKCVTRRFFGQTSEQSRRYYLVDLTILAGFLVILVTGLGMSTWLNLELPSYVTWRSLHITATIVTLFVLVAKIGLHWRWVVKTARQMTEPQPRPASVRPAPASVGPAPVAVRPAPVAIRPAPVAVRPALQPVPVRAAPAAMSRRDFLKLMGVVSAAAVFASAQVLDQDNHSQALAAAGDTSSAGSEATAEATAAAVTAAAAEASPTAEADSLPVVESASACTVRCNRGCSYPGHCRRYTDNNGNDRCDLGECL